MSARFPFRHEIARQYAAMHRFAHEVGVRVLWYRYDREGSGDYDIYGEESDETLHTYHEPRPIQAVNMHPMESIRHGDAGGQYTVDRMRGVFSYADFRDAGIPGLDPDLVTDRSVLKDRVRFSKRLWRPVHIEYAGNPRDYDVTVAVRFEELRPDDVLTFDAAIGDQPPPPPAP